MMAGDSMTTRQRTLQLLRTLLVALLVATVASILVWSGVLWRADSWYYDALLDHGGQRADDRIVIVAIDDKSLAALGRWPWPRKYHADLLGRLAKAKPRGIALDVVFAEPDYDAPDNDRALARAVADAGRVVLPVMVEPTESSGTLVEVLPIPGLVDAAAGLGHVVVDTDPDGATRSAYLHAGLADPHWPALALALYQLDPQLRTRPVPGLRNPDKQASPYVWVRDHHVRVPYATGPGFQQVSFIDVIRGQVPPGLLRDRWLLVGVTAYGIGDRIQTPLSNAGNRIDGVTYQANLLNMLLQHRAITPLPLAWSWLLTLLFSVLPAVLVLRYRGRRVGWLLPATLLAVAAASALLLYAAHLWFAPTATLVTLLLASALFGAYHLRRSQRMAHSDGLTKLANRRMFDLMLRRELASGRRTGRPLSLLLIDVDHFKHFNDSYGHQAGDAMLQALANAIAVHARRPRDLVARHGGDELSVLLPETSAAKAVEIADAIVAEVRALQIAHMQSRVAPHVSVSIGVASTGPLAKTQDETLFERADAALYQAKQLGRNRSYLAPAWDA